MPLYISEVLIELSTYLIPEAPSDCSEDAG